jgi:hypothetical protein
VSTVIGREKRAMKRAILATLVLAAAAVWCGVSNAQALGWNFVRVSFCYGLSVGGVDYLYFYPTTGGSILTNDPVVVTAGAQFCANGTAFYIYWNGVTYNGIAIYPGLK